MQEQLLEQIAASPTPFHAVQTMASLLIDAGFKRMYEQDDWGEVEAGRYFVTRNDSSLIAFKSSAQGLSKHGMRLLGAHTDSPCLKIKPQPDIKQARFLQLGVEVYGGALLNPWFDRDLSLAGRVSYESKSGGIKSVLIDFESPIAVVPSLAIHLDKSANKERSVNPQTDMPVVIALAGGSYSGFHGLLKQKLIADDVDVANILDFEIYCYDTQRPSVIGLNKEFIASARLDNLLSCFVGIQALINSDDDVPSLLVCNDHEEVGSGSAAGARGPFLHNVLDRLQPDSIKRAQLVSRSMMISVDNAHGLHPNYTKKHDGNHGPIINSGPVIKVNAQQRYATNSNTSAVFRHLCNKTDVPIQSFVVRTDMACGSTIGPITAAEIGIPTIDIGVPTFAMHSIRELAGTKDVDYLLQALTSFVELSELPWSNQSA